MHNTETMIRAWASPDDNETKIASYPNKKLNKKLRKLYTLSLNSYPKTFGSSEQDNRLLTDL